MKIPIEFLITTLFIIIGALMFYMTWNQISYLFPCLPEQWRHLDWWTSFCLLWTIRSVTTIMREPVKTSMKEKE